VILGHNGLTQAALNDLFERDCIVGLENQLWRHDAPEDPDAVICFYPHEIVHEIRIRHSPSPSSELPLSPNSRS
jgi:hypothetical protein